MSGGLADLEGAVFPARSYEVSVEKIREFAAAIGDGSFASGEVAPPTFAALYGLTAVADLLAEPAVAPHLGRVIHAEQELTWEREIRAHEVLTTTGRVAGVRERSGAWFITVAAETESEDGLAIATATSTLVVGGAP